MVKNFPITMGGGGRFILFNIKTAHTRKHLNGSKIPKTVNNLFY